MPSLYDYPEIGEAALKDPLAYDEVEAAPFEQFENSLFKEDLKRLSAERVAKSREFGYVKSDLTRLKDRIDTNTISLNEKERRAEIAEQKTRKDRRLADRAKRSAPAEKVFAVTLDNVDQQDLQPASNLSAEANRQKKVSDALEAKAEGEPEEEEDPYDAVRFEAINIVTDLINLTAKAARTVSVSQK